MINWTKKLLHKAWKKIDKDDVLSEYNQSGFDLFKMTLYNDDTIKFLSPRNTDKMYIVTKEYILNNEINTFVLFEHSMSNESKLSIINHEYKYDFLIPKKTSNIMKNMFEDKVEDDRNKMEQEIMGNINNGILLVLEDFKKRLENTEV